MYEQARPGAGDPFGGAGTSTPGAAAAATAPSARKNCATCSAPRIRSRTSSRRSSAAATRAGERARAAAAAAARARKGRDVEQEIELTLEDAFQGVTRRLAIKHDGHTRTVDVRIPAGVGDGSRVRVSGEGEQGGGGGGSGDLYLRIRLQPHPVFTRKGPDLHAKIRVPVTTAVLGGEADVPTITGKPLRLRVPPTTQNGQVFRLKGHGMPLSGKTQERGDLFATVEMSCRRH